MTSILKEKIQEYINTQTFSVRELERQSGLGHNAIHNILSDRSKSPSIDTVLKIADAFNCSLDEMLGRTKFIHRPQPSTNSVIILDTNLFKMVCINVAEFIESNNIQDLKLLDAVHCIEEIYKYCLNNSSKALDKNFAKWFLEQKFNIASDF